MIGLRLLSRRRRRRRRCRPLLSSLPSGHSLLCNAVQTDKQADGPRSSDGCSYSGELRAAQALTEAHKKQYGGHLSSVFLAEPYACVYVQSPYT